MVLKKADPELFKNIAAILGSTGTSITIIPHENPDGDAVGSAIGLGNILANRGHKAVVISPNGYPAYYDWLEKKTDLLFFDSQKKKAKKVIEASDILICVDFNDINRAGKMEKIVADFKGPKILIDHHPDPQNFCDFLVTDTSYSSTAEIIFDFISELGFKEFIDKSVAECLFAGIMTDTGSFSHNISHPNTFMVISELLVFGVNAENIHNRVYNNFSSDRIRLLGYCLNDKMEILPEFRTAIISITKDELKNFNFVPGDTEGFVNFPLSITGIVFSALFIEKEDHVKISFRSKGSFPVNSFSASHFSGGGHLNAAGGEAKLSLENSLILFKQLLPEYLHQLNNEGN